MYTVLLWEQQNSMCMILSKSVNMNWGTHNRKNKLEIMKSWSRGVFVLRHFFCHHLYVHLLPALSVLVSTKYPLVHRFIVVMVEKRDDFVGIWGLC